MNAAARALHQGNLFQGDFSSALFFKRNALTVLAWMLVLASALSVIYLRHIERDYFSQLQTVERQINRAKLEYGQLLLEQSMWTSPKRVEKLVKDKFEMHRATPAAVIIIKQSQKAEQSKHIQQYAFIHKPTMSMATHTV